MGNFLYNRLGESGFFRTPNLTFWGTGNFLKVRLNSVKGDLSYIDVLAL